MNGFLTMILGFWVCLGIALVAIRMAPKLGLMDVPGGRRRHERPVALVGGLALIMTQMVRMLVLHFHSPLTHLEQGAVLGMALLGLMDDRFGIRARWKALLGLGVAILLAHATATDLARLTHPIPFLGASISPTSWVIPLLLVLMYWGLPHGFNLIDGANGLATGFSLMVLCSLWGGGSPHPFFLGTLLACLLLNWPRAKLFLGDCGSLSIGLLLVLLAKNALLQQSATRLLWLFAYPIVDVIMVVLIRLAQGRNLGVGDRNHIHCQIKDRWPQMEVWIAPLLVGLAALCASKVYLPENWGILPWAGLVTLSITAVIFGARALASGTPSIPMPGAQCLKPVAGTLAEGAVAMERETVQEEETVNF
jgi:UDP-GlcNAc:undecaprenyl-phosphate GlcNAc-1-phosphate transferase